MRILKKILILLFLTSHLVGAQEITVAGGIGVNLINAPELVDFFNNFSTTGESIDDFNTAFEFFGSVGYPVSEGWSIRLEYSYLFNSINISNAGWEVENFYSVHMPTILLKRIIGEQDSPLSGSIGAGYRAAVLTHKILGDAEKKYYSKGLGLKAGAELNTPFGDGLYGYIAGDIAFNFMSDYKDDNGHKLTYTQIRSEKTVCMDFFSVGLKFGLIFYI
jgi:hypothetical protein